VTGILRDWRVRHVPALGGVLGLRRRIVFAAVRLHVFCFLRHTASGGRISAARCIADADTHRRQTGENRRDRAVDESMRMTWRRAGAAVTIER
jgi:hypothetical protein